MDIEAAPLTNSFSDSHNHILNWRGIPWGSKPPTLNRRPKSIRNDLRSYQLISLYGPLRFHRRKTYPPQMSDPRSRNPNAVEAKKEKSQELFRRYVFFAVRRRPRSTSSALDGRLLRLRRSPFSSSPRLPPSSQGVDVVN